MPHNLHYFHGLWLRARHGPQNIKNGSSTVLFLWLASFSAMPVVAPRTPGNMASTLNLLTKCKADSRLCSDCFPLQCEVVYSHFGKTPLYEINQLFFSSDIQRKFVVAFRYSVILFFFHIRPSSPS